MNTIPKTLYRWKINTPWGKKGEIVSKQNELGTFYLESPGGYTFACSMNNYPDLFEPTPEIDPTQKVGEWLEQKAREWYSIRSEIGDTSKSNTTYIAKALIASGLDPERLK